MTAEQFIKDYTRTDSNELIAVEDIHGTTVISYREWLTPEQALRAVELGRNNLWKPADGDDLPEIDREVVALALEHEHYKVVFAHRIAEGAAVHTSIDGKPLVLHRMRYGKGGWNQPNVKWWLDLDLPNVEE